MDTSQNSGRVSPLLSLNPDAEQHSTNQNITSKNPLLSRVLVENHADQQHWFPKPLHKFNRGQLPMKKTEELVAPSVSNHTMQHESVRTGQSQSEDNQALQHMLEKSSQEKFIANQCLEKQPPNVIMRNEVPEENQLQQTYPDIRKHENPLLLKQCPSKEKLQNVTGNVGSPMLPCYPENDNRELSVAANVHPPKEPLKVKAGDQQDERTVLPDVPLMNKDQERSVIPKHLVPECSSSNINKEVVSRAQVTSASVELQTEQHVQEILCQRQENIQAVERGHISNTAQLKTHRKEKGASEVQGSSVEKMQNIKSSNQSNNKPDVHQPDPSESKLSDIQQRKVYCKRKVEHSNFNHHKRKRADPHDGATRSNQLQGGHAHFRENCPSWPERLWDHSQKLLQFAQTKKPMHHIPMGGQHINGESWDHNSHQFLPPYPNLPLIGQANQLQNTHHPYPNLQTYPHQQLSQPVCVNQQIQQMQRQQQSQQIQHRYAQQMQHMLQYAEQYKMKHTLRPSCNMQHIFAPKHHAPIAMVHPQVIPPTNTVQTSDTPQVKATSSDYDLSLDSKSIPNQSCVSGSSSSPDIQNKTPSQTFGIPTHFPNPYPVDKSSSYPPNVDVMHLPWNNSSNQTYLYPSSASANTSCSVDNHQIATATQHIAAHPLQNPYSLSGSAFKPPWQMNVPSQQQFLCNLQSSSQTQPLIASSGPDQMPDDGD